MRSNFNTPQTAAPELGKTSWDFGDPVSSGVPSLSSGSEWDWGVPSSPSTTIDSDWAMSRPNFEDPVSSPDSARGERLRELKDKVSTALGMKALGVVMNRLPNFAKREKLEAAAVNFTQDSAMRQNMRNTFLNAPANFEGYRNEAKQFAVTAGVEVAKVGAAAAKEEVMRYYGLEKGENEKLRIARKIKFGKAVVKTVVNPVGTVSSVGVRAGKAARKASKQEARNQYKVAGQHISQYSQAPTNVPGLSYENW